MFEFLVNGFNIFLYRPLFNFLILIYNYLPKHDFGIAIICLTIIIRFILYPLSIKAVQSQRILQRLQPELEEIKKKYKDDKEKQGMEILGLYKREKLNPFGGLFLIIVQFPILIALYRVFSEGLKPEELSKLYSFVLNPVNINLMFLNVIDLSKPSIVFAVLAGIIQFFQTKMLMPKFNKDQSKKNDINMIMQKQMLYIFPFITIIILFNLPSALSLYWIVGGLFSIIQQYFIIKHVDSRRD